MGIINELEDVFAKRLEREGSSKENARRYAKAIVDEFSNIYGGETHYIGKMEATQREIRDNEIRSMGSMYTTRELAERFSISQTRICQILNRPE